MSNNHNSINELIEADILLSGVYRDAGNNELVNGSTVLETIRRLHGSSDDSVRVFLADLTPATRQETTAFCAAVLAKIIRLRKHLVDEITYLTGCDVSVNISLYGDTQFTYPFFVPARSMIGAELVEYKASQWVYLDRGLDGGISVFGPPALTPETPSETVA